jgi:N-acetylmuramoyl-L-alanine amidase
MRKTASLHKRTSHLKLNFSLFFLLVIFLCRLNAASFFDYPISTVILDAGHGGEDSGAVASYDFNPDIKEKDIVLDIALKVESYLSKNLPEIKIIQTRVDDSFPSLQERSEIAYLIQLDDKSASLFVSIHANSAEVESAEGFEVYTKLENKVIYLYDSSTPLENIDLFTADNLYTLNRKQYDTSYELSSNILDSVIKSFPQISNRGIKSDDLFVLNVCRTTACLIEVGFLSNKEEAKLLLDSAYRDRMALAISEGIVTTIKNRK